MDGCGPLRFVPCAGGRNPSSLTAPSWWVDEKGEMNAAGHAAPGDLVPLIPRRRRGVMSCGVLMLARTGWLTPSLPPPRAVCSEWKSVLDLARLYMANNSTAPPPLPSETGESRVTELSAAEAARAKAKAGQAAEAEDPAMAEHRFAAGGAWICAHACGIYMKGCSLRLIVAGKKRKEGKEGSCLFDRCKNAP